MAGKGEMVRLVLKAAAIGGITLLALTSRRGTRAIISLAKEELSKRQKYYLSTVAKRLKQEGLIRITSEGEIELTDKGREQLRTWSANEEVIIKPKTWDGKYRVIIFDVPEKKGNLRTIIRRQLAAWGFVKLQKSVWVHPYECEQVTSLLKMKFGLQENVLYLTVDSIENDGWLKENFGLA